MYILKILILTICIVLKSEAEMAKKDIDECSAGTHVCSQKCTNIPGSYSCSCTKGYITYNVTGCRATGPEPILVFNTGSQIRIVKLHSFEINLTHNQIEQTVGLTYDSTDEHFYWNKVDNNYDAIMRSRMDGTSTEPFIVTGIHFLRGIALDWIGRNLYFTDGLVRHIAACSLVKRICAIVTNNVNNPTSIVVDPEQGLLYWTDWGIISPIIGRAGMDGSQRQSFVNASLPYPNGLAIDHLQNRLYWADAVFHKIESIDLDGKNRKVILADGIYHPFVIDVFEDSIYWADWHKHTIEACNKVTGRQHVTIAMKNARIKPMEVHVYHPVMQPKGLFNSCKNANCSHFCLLAPMHQYRCVCPAGFHLDSNAKTCSENADADFIFVSAAGDLSKFHPNAIGNNVFLPVPIFWSLWISAMAYNPSSNSIYAADQSTKTILALNLNKFHVNTLAVADISYIVAMVFDQIAENIYWVDFARNSVDVYNIEKQMHASIAKVDRPMSLDILPTEGIMFVALTGDEPRIQKMSMDGSNPETIVSFKRMLPWSIVVEPNRKIIYWSDKVSKCIWKSSYKFNETERFQDGGSFTSLMLLNSTFLFWVNVENQTIVWHKIMIFNIPRTIGKISLPDPTTKPIVLLYANRKKLEGSNNCSQKTHNCSHFCLSSPNGGSCGCPIGMKLDTDQQNCITTGCTRKEFQCTNGQCIPSQWRCDFEKDCADGSDEENCAKNCTANEYKCSYYVCILKEFVCNYHNDCPDGSDENNCRAYQENKFICNNNNRIDTIYKCDGNDDCGDGSDEETCTQLASCPTHKYMCPASRKCISKQNVCDTFINCPDGEDELNCGELNQLILSRATGIFRLSLDHRNFSLIIAETKTAQIKAIDCFSNAIYWVEYSTGTIKRLVNESEDTIVTNLDRPSSMAVDWITGNIYYWDRKNNLTVCSSSEKNLCADLVNTGDEEVESIAVDPHRGMMFWAVSTSSSVHDIGKIYSGGMDGKNVKVLVDKEIVWPTVIVADATDTHVFWADYSINCIETIRYYGGNRRTVNMNSGGPISLAILENMMYWYAVDHTAIMACYKFECSSPKIFEHQFFKITSLFVLDPNLHSPKINACSKAKCDLCVLGIAKTSSCLNISIQHTTPTIKPLISSPNQSDLSKTAEPDFSTTKYELQNTTISNCSLLCKNGGVCLFKNVTKCRVQASFRRFWDRLRSSAILNSKKIHFQTNDTNADCQPIVSIHDDYTNDEFQSERILTTMKSTPIENSEIEPYSDDLY